MMTGYQYRDVVKEAVVNEPKFTLGAPFSPSLTVSFNIRDMKYLSNSNQTLVTTTDTDVMYGLKTLPITLNFQDLLDQDAAGTTYFVVGGRVYFEATVSGTNTNTFISKGFFD